MQLPSPLGQSPSLPQSPPSAGTSFWPPMAGEIGVTDRSYVPGDVRRYGAKGDGVTDDSAQIMNAHDSLPIAGGTLWFGPGAYVASGLVFTKKVNIVMAGGASVQFGVPPSAYIVKPASAHSTCIVLAGEGSRWNGGGIQGVSGNTGDGVQIKANSVACRDVSVTNVGGRGFFVGNQAPGAPNANLWYLGNCRAASNGSHGFHINGGDAVGTANANAGQADNCASLVNGGDGFRVDNAIVNTFVGCTPEQNTGVGVRFTASSINNKWFGGDTDENNVGGNILLEAGATRNILVGMNDNGLIDNGTGTIIVSAFGTQFRDILLGSGTSRLNAYEEGTWTPTLAGSTTAGVQTYATRVAQYTRIGRICHISGSITLSAKDAATAGNMRITGLPFPAINTVGMQWGIHLGSWDQITITGAGYTVPAAVINAGQQFITLLQSGSAVNASFLPAANIAATTNIVFSATYQVA